MSTLTEFRFRSVVLWSGFLTVLLLAAQNGSADPLTEALQEEKAFYDNYGEKDYQRLDIQKEIKSYYDLFGEHIVDGFFIYELSQRKTEISNDRVDDSIFLSQNTIFESKEFSSNFKNLVITRDAIGSSKFAFLIGNQVQTQFTPLTLNKLNFHALRWDLWTSGLKMTTAVARTRPDWVAKDFGKDKNNTGRSAVSFPVQPEDFYAPVDGVNVTEQSVDRLETGDLSNKSVYGDYDMIFALHAENKLGNFLKYGITYMNHHHSDVRQGEQWYGGVPAEYFPEEIHFEVYDATPNIRTDAGALVSTFKMDVGGSLYPPFEVYYPVGVDSILEALGPNRPTYETDGHRPLVFTFKPEFQTGRDAKNFEDLKFRFGVSGNYRVFVSTDRFGTPKFNQVVFRIDPEENRTEIETEPLLTTVEEISKSSRKNIWDPGLDFTEAPQNFFGQFIAMSPTVIRSREKIAGTYGNSSSYVYDYQLNKSSETFGVNFHAFLGRFDLKGELQVNTKRYILPGSSAEVDKRRTLAGYSELIGDVVTDVNMAARGYYLGPNWTTALEDYSVSPFFSKGLLPSNDFSYLDPIRPLSNNWNPIDDNEDRDQFVESEARQYPADGGAQEDFWYSGALRVRGQKAIRVTMPNQFKKIYDDPDGVISDRIDKNRNGQPDYLEDFLLFYQDNPIFELGNDLNANNVFDQEDDDIYPDIYFITQGEHPEYQPSPVYIYTSNGFYSLGIQGGSLRFRYDVNDNLSTEIGGLYERAVTSSFGYDEKTELFEFLTYEADGRLPSNLNLNNTTRYRVINRAKGIEINLENEVRYLEDNIRNDAVLTIPKTFTAPLAYGFQTDEMQYRKAVLDNAIIRFTYQPRNFLVQTKTRVGAEKRYAIEEPGAFLITKTIKEVDPFGRTSFSYEDVYEPYREREILKFNWIGKLRYDLVWRQTYDVGWRQNFNWLTRLQVSPQIKLTYDYQTSKFPWQEDNLYTVDPRENAQFDPTQRESLLRFQEYVNQNQNKVNVVPILRSAFQLAEKTRVEFGHQWLYHYDLLINERNFTKNTTLLQLRNHDNYKGNVVNLILGMKMENLNYALEGELGYDPLLKIGEPYDRWNYEVFAQIYTGI